MLDPVHLARRFIDIPSVTGEEAAMADACAEVLRASGWNVQLDPVTANRSNVVATLDAPRVLLCSHLDTVPPFIPASEDEAWLYGRGACDTKGIIAAMMGAAVKLQEQDGIRDLGILLVVGEETDSIGAKHANATLSFPEVRYTLVGEPTESRFAKAQKGGLKCTLRVRGRAAHSGYPEQGASAVLALLDLLQRVRDADWGHDPLLGPGTANIGVVRGGLRANIVPEKAEAEVFVRVVDSVDAVRRRFKQIQDGCAFPVERTEETCNGPVRLATIPGYPDTVVAFNTDVPHLTRFGMPLLMGPGSILDAHNEHERIGKRELLAAVDLYCEAVCALRAQPAKVTMPLVEAEPADPSKGRFE